MTIFEKSNFLWLVIFTRILCQVDVGLKFSHWNLNSIIAHDRIKIPLIEAYNSTFHYEIIVLSETIINNSIPDEDIFIEGFSEEIFRSDHPSGDKKGGVVCIYFKETLPLNVGRIWKVCKKPLSLR